MDRLRAEARAFLQQADQDSITNFSAHAAIDIKTGALDELWRDISSNDPAGDLEVSDLFFYSVVTHPPIRPSKVCCSLDGFCSVAVVSAVSTASCRSCSLVASR
jgi:hypothetical protein